MALLKSAFLAIILAFLFFATLTEQQIVRDLANGLSYANFGKQKRFRLNAGQLENTTAQSSSQCCAKCLPNKNCFSVNYGGIGRNECQLLSANKFQSSDQMMIDKTFEHFSVVSPCDKEPCLNGGKCIPLYEQNGYRCQCPWQFNVQKHCEEGRTLSSADVTDFALLPGNWTAFWWYDIDTTWPSHENDVLAYEFGHCQASDPYCFGRLPSDAIAASTEMLAIDSQGNEYFWGFGAATPAAHAAWRAFHDHEVIYFGEVKDVSPPWDPLVLKGFRPSHSQDSFMYREEQGVKSVLLDDDNCDCYSSLSLGHALCLTNHEISYGPTGQYGVDALYDSYCNVPRQGVGLSLYFRAMP